MAKRIVRTAPMATHPKDRALFERIDEVLAEYEARLRPQPAPRRRSRRTQ
jgi:hypothetical protein